MRCPWNRPISTRRPRRYAATLVELAGSPPILDLVHLGLGADGHTASLVPGDAVLDVTDTDVALTGRVPGTAPDDADLSGPQPGAARALADHRRRQGGHARPPVPRGFEHSRRTRTSRTTPWCSRTARADGSHVKRRRSAALVKGVRRELDTAARHELSPRRHGLSGWRQLQRVLEARHRRAVAPVRSRRRWRARARHRPQSPASAVVPLLARLRARYHRRSALRLSCRWTVRSGARTSFRSRQGSARSVRKVRGAARGLEPRGGVRAGRQLRHGLEERRRGSRGRTTGRATVHLTPTLRGRLCTRCTWGPSHGTPTPASRRRSAERIRA